MAPGCGNRSETICPLRTFVGILGRENNLFGGTDGNVYKNDLWAFDFTSSKWDEFNLAMESQDDGPVIHQFFTTIKWQYLVVMIRIRTKMIPGF